MDDPTGPKPIQTEYAGHLFRSRLEARWAVFFDALGVPWKYESQGYRVGPDEDAENYLPDFLLPGLGLWVEVKGQATERDIRVLTKAANAQTAGGLPGDSQLRIVVLGDLPRPDYGDVPLHTGLYWDGSEVRNAFVAWTPGGRPWVLRSPFTTRTMDPALLTRPVALLSGWGFGAAVYEAYAAARTARFEWGATP